VRREAERQICEGRTHRATRKSKPGDRDKAVVKFADIVIIVPGLIGAVLSKGKDLWGTSPGALWRIGSRSRSWTTNGTISASR
jgi:hypothetical protein